jgi:hypothetical protein
MHGGRYYFILAEDALAQTDKEGESNSRVNYHNPNDKGFPASTELQSQA